MNNRITTKEVSRKRTIGELRSGDMFTFENTSHWHYMKLDLSVDYFKNFPTFGKVAYTCLENGQVYLIDADHLIGPMYSHLVLDAE